MHFLDILQKKRDGGTLTQEELHAVISGCVMGTIPDYQLSAFLMAVFYQGMTDEETAPVSYTHLKISSIRMVRASCRFMGLLSSAKIR